MTFKTPVSSLADKKRLHSNNEVKPSLRLGQHRSRLSPSRAGFKSCVKPKTNIVRPENLTCTSPALMETYVTHSIYSIQVRFCMVKANAQRTCMSSVCIWTSSCVGSPASTAPRPSPELPSGGCGLDETPECFLRSVIEKTNRLTGKCEGV